MDMLLLLPPLSSMLAIINPAMKVLCMSKTLMELQYLLSHVMWRPQKDHTAKAVHIIHTI